MKLKPQVVFDTNIYISAIIFGGNPRTCLDLARDGKIKLITTRNILYELSQKLIFKFAWEDKDVIEVIEGLSKFTHIIKPKSKVSIVKKDHSDNIILECAKDAKQAFIVSGDTKHILPIKKFGKSIILSAKNFLNAYYKNSR